VLLACPVLGKRRRPAKAKEAANVTVAALEPGAAAACPGKYWFQVPGHSI
jgi:hypothetical protein